MKHQATRNVAMALLMSASSLGVDARSDIRDALAQRQANASDLVDPVTMPYCPTSSCWERDAPPPTICPLVNGPCPDNSQASDNGGSKCGMKQYTKECYCNLKTGLSCAWSCTWGAWWNTEDWFAKVCPDSPALKLDFSGLPKCARGCLDDASFYYGCLTQTSNCFCAHGDLFGCQDKCSTQDEWREIEDWLQDACDISATNAKLALQQGYFYLASEPSTGTVKDVGPPRPAPRKALTWGEDLILAIISFSVAVGLGLWVAHCVMSGSRRKSPKLR